MCAYYWSISNKCLLSNSNTLLEHRHSKIPLDLLAGASINSYGPPGSYATTGRHPQNQPLQVNRLKSRGDRPADSRNNPYIDTPASMSRTGSAASAAEMSLSSTYRPPGAVDNSGALNTAPLSSTVGPNAQWGPQSLPATGPLRQAPPPPPPSGRSGNQTAPLQSHQRTLLATRSQHMPSAASPLVGRHARNANSGGAQCSHIARRATAFHIVESSEPYFWSAEYSAVIIHAAGLRRPVDTIKSASSAELQQLHKSAGTTTTSATVSVFTRRASRSALIALNYFSSTQFSYSLFNDIFIIRVSSVSHDQICLYLFCTI